MYSLADVLNYVREDFSINVVEEANVTVITTDDLDAVTCLLTQIAELIYNDCLDFDDLHVNFDTDPIMIRIG